MEFTTTDGKRYTVADQCACCSIDTAGNHEGNCPMHAYRVGFWKENRQVILKI